MKRDHVIDRDDVLFATYRQRFASAGPSTVIPHEATVLVTSLALLTSRLPRSMFQVLGKRRRARAGKQRAQFVLVTKLRAKPSLGGHRVAVLARLPHLAYQSGVAANQSCLYASTLSFIVGAQRVIPSARTVSSS